VRPRWIVSALTLALTACAKKAPQKTHAEPSAALAPPAASVALAGLPAGNIRARLETSEGAVHCELEPATAPRAVALFVGLATGRASWLDPRAHAVVTRPMYRELTFFRAVPNAFVQTGCPLGNGTGTPGYRIAIETSPNDARRLARAGALLLAAYHAPPNRVDPSPPPPGQIIGSQFVIALGDLSHMAGQVSVLGSCHDLDNVRAIAAKVASRGEAHLERVVIEGIND
jgi:peptidyl-prolyl cis-trans isomerase A (cyclophilin A)